MLAPRSTRGDAGAGVRQHGDVPDVRNRIEQLLIELRSWEPGEARRTVVELADRFGLEPFVVDRIARSEGHVLRVDAPVTVDEETDPSASTLDLDPDAVSQALEEPDPNPEWEDEDRDTGVWRKKPTGEWELVEHED